VLGKVDPRMRCVCLLLNEFDLKRKNDDSILVGDVCVCCNGSVQFGFGMMMNSGLW
jgi:hypothetical protein